MRRVAAVVAGLLLAGCGGSGDSAAEVPAPAPEGAAAELCRALVERLPDSMYEQERRPVEPESDFAAAWGDPAVVVRCGVERPEALQADSELIAVNEVAWLPQPPERPSLYTAVGHEVYVEMSIPPSYEPPALGLLPVSRIIQEDIPPLPDGQL